MFDTDIKEMFGCTVIDVEKSADETVYTLKPTRTLAMLDFIDEMHSDSSVRILVCKVVDFKTGQFIKGSYYSTDKSEATDFTEKDMLKIIAAITIKEKRRFGIKYDEVLFKLAKDEEPKPIYRAKALGKGCASDKSLHLRQYKYLNNLSAFTRMTRR